MVMKESGITMLLRLDNMVMKRKSGFTSGRLLTPPPEAAQGAQTLPGEATDSTTSELFNATRAIFVAEGAKALTVRRIADAAGCTTMAVYSRYGGKDGLLTALFDEGFDRLREAQIAVDQSLGPEAYLVALCVAYRDTAAKYGAHYALMLGRDSGEFTPNPASRAAAYETLNVLIGAAQRFLQPKRPEAGPHATALAMQLFAFCHGWASLEAIGFGPPNEIMAQAFTAALSAMIETARTS
jgi:AcrR family transcriptional regulator